MKMHYTTPQIKEIRLDNDISLQLQSSSPTFNPDESVGTLSPMRKDPYEYDGWN